MKSKNLTSIFSKTQISRFVDFLFLKTFMFSYPGSLAWFFYAYICLCFWGSHVLTFYTYFKILRRSPLRVSVPMLNYGMFSTFSIQRSAHGYGFGKTKTCFDPRRLGHGKWRYSGCQHRISLMRHVEENLKYLFNDRQDPRKHQELQSYTAHLCDAKTKIIALYFLQQKILYFR